MICLISLRFFDQNLRSLILSDGRTGASFKFEQMVKEETEVLYAFKGAYTYSDLQNMTEYEVMLITEAYKDIKEIERIALEKAKENQGNNTMDIVDTIVLKNSRFNLPEEDKNPPKD